MLRSVFATMNEMLDQIHEQYPTADAAEKSGLQEQLNALKAMSDTFIEEWLRFEEKMGMIIEQCQLVPTPFPYGDDLSASFETAESFEPTPLMEEPLHPEPYVRGKGYFQLMMFPQAVCELEKAVRLQPEFLPARMYLAFGYLRTGNFGEAYRHFQFIVPLAEDPKMKAVSYNAMGCIQVLNRNTDKACEYFVLAHQTDPTLPEPVANLKACLESEGLIH